MKKYNPIYYLLFILLVMGTFASMAQNNYGLKIMGGVAFVFAMVFLIQLISGLTKKEKVAPLQSAEPTCLFIIAVIFGLRVFYIQFPFVGWLFAGAAAILASIYIARMITRFGQVYPKNRLLASLVAIFHSSVILFLGALAIAPYSIAMAEAAAATAFVLITLFTVASLVKNEFLVDGASVSAFRLVRTFRDHSMVIVILLALFSLYTGLNSIGFLPRIYSDQFPRAYFHLVEQASSKKEKPVNGKYRHEEFMESYSQFLRNQNRESQ